MTATRVAIVGILVVTLTTVSAAQPPATIERAVDTWLEPFVELDVFSGAVLIARGESVLHRKAYGLANREFEVRASPDHVFPIGSISKIFTSLTFRLLRHGRVVESDTPLARYLPGFPAAERITLLQLLSHRSGLPHTSDLEWFVREQAIHHDLRELVARLGAEPLRFEPGARYGYSTGGYIVLAAALEVATGLPYGKLLERYVLGPLGLEHTAHETAHDLVKYRVSGYVAGLEGPMRGPHLDLANRIGGGSIHSTVDDLYRLDRSLVDLGLPPDEIEAMFLRLEGARPAWLARGSLPGFKALWKRILAEDVVIIVLSNSDSRAVEEVVLGLESIVFGQQATSGMAPFLEDGGFRRAALDVASLAALSGRYAQGEVEFRLRTQGGTLVREGLGRPPYALVPVAEARFLDPAVWGVLSLSRGTSRDEVTGTWFWPDVPTLQTAVRRVGALERAR